MEYEFMSILSYEDGIGLEYNDIVQCHLLLVDSVDVVAIASDVYKNFYSIVLIMYGGGYEDESIFMEIKCRGMSKWDIEVS
jgi:hypothetical protein